MSRGDKSEPVEGFVTLHIPSKYGYLRIVRQSVLDTCVRAGLSEFDAAQMEMAVDESCSSVIEHSYGGESALDENAREAGIRINLIQKKDRVIVEICDRGTGFDFEGFETAQPEQYLDTDDERGLGMYIIKKFVDDASYVRGGPDGNCLTLIKNI